MSPADCPRALAGSCSDATDAYHGLICAPNLNASHASAVPLPPELADDPYARGNAEYARMVKETVEHLVKVHGVEEVRRWRFEGWNGAQPAALSNVPLCLRTACPVAALIPRPPFIDRIAMLRFSVPVRSIAISPLRCD